MFDHETRPDVLAVVLYSGTVQDVLSGQESTSAKWLELAHAKRVDQQRDEVRFEDSLLLKPLSEHEPDESYLDAYSILQEELANRISYFSLNI